MSETKKDTTKSESKPSPSEKKPTTKKVMKPKVKSEPVPPATSTESTYTSSTKKVPGPSIRVFVRKNGEEQGKALSFDTSAPWNAFTSLAKKLLSLSNTVTYRVFLSSLDELTASNQLRDGDILYLHDGELSTLLVGNSEANLWRTMPIILNEMVRRSDATRMAQFARMNFPVTDGQFDPASFAFGPAQYPLSATSSTTTNTTSPTKESPQRETKKSVESTKTTKQEQKTVHVPKKEKNVANGTNNTGATTASTSTSTSTSTSKNDYPSGRYQQRHVVNRRGGYGYTNNYRWNQTRATYVSVYEVEVIGGQYKGKKGTVSAHFWNKSEQHDHFLLRVFLDDDGGAMFQKIYSEDLKKTKDTPIKKQLRSRDNGEEDDEEYESDGTSA